MKALSTPFFRNKTVTALVFSLLLVGGAAFFFDKPAEQVSADTIVGGGASDLGRPDAGGGGSAVPAGTPLCGFAWGGTDEGTGMGVGWVSFNSKDCDTNGDGTFNDGIAGCPTSGPVANYGVSVDSGGRLNGYAWSSTVGWIKFGCSPNNLSCLSGYPNNGGRVTIVGTGEVRNVQGFARACAGTESGNCTTSTSRTDGWDGWINLMGNSSYGVKFNQTEQKFSGYAWGDEVVGWLNFAAPTAVSSARQVRYCTSQTVGAVLSANPSSGTGSVDDVDLTVQIVGTATGVSQVRFDCQNDGTYDTSLISVPANSNTYTAVDLCDYTSNSTAKVEVTRGGLPPVTATTQITVDPVVSGTLTVDCQVSPEVAVNQTATWTANVTLGPTPAVSPFTYTFTFDDGQQNPSPIVCPGNNMCSGGLSVGVPRTYSTLGPKAVTVNVRDSGVQTATGVCTANTNVVVNPSIIEI